MADQPDNLVLEHLRAIREDLNQVRAEQREQRTRLGSIERLLTHSEHEFAELRAETSAIRSDIGGRLDRVTDRLERIERRLNLADA
jgi:septal ring factor EnvC (AmiA/AmiB activator)